MVSAGTFLRKNGTTGLSCSWFAT